MDMKKVAVQSLTANKYITAPVFLDDNFILLSPDIPVSQTLLHRLIKWEFREVYTDGQPSGAPPRSPEQVQSFQVDDESSAGSLDTSERQSKEQARVTEFYKTQCKFLQAYFDRYINKGVLDIRSVTDAVKLIITEVKENRQSVLAMPEEIEHCSTNYLLPSSVRATVLLMALADRLNLPPHKMIEVGIAGMLHDLGFLRLPKDIYSTNRPLTDKERQILKTHPILGFKSLKAAEFPLPICMAVLEHQEHMDGSGYPRALIGDKISLYGKMLSIVCSYEAATSKRPFKQHLTGHRGLMDLLSQMGKRYDEHILRNLIYILSIYPLGTYVELTDTSRGIVIKTIENDPKHPIIQLVLDKDGNPFVQRPLFQPKDNEGLQIQKALDHNEIKNLISKLNFANSENS